MTQAAQLVAALRKGWHTTGDLQALRISPCPWKRLAESGARYLKPGEVIERKTGPDKLIRLRVRKVSQ